MLRRFCANLLTISNFASGVKLFFCCPAWFLLRFRLQRSLLRSKVTPRKISKIDQRTMRPATWAHGRSTPGSCTGLFSEGFPTGAQGHLPHLTQRTPLLRLPTSLNRGRPQWPPGGFLTHLQLFKSTTRCSPLQAEGARSAADLVQLFENSKRPVMTQAAALWKMWETVRRLSFYAAFYCCVRLLVVTAKSSISAAPGFQDLSIH